MGTIRDQYDVAHVLPGPFVSIEDIKSANSAKGEYWFSPQSMKFFNSKIEHKVYAGRLFITSEQFVGSDGHKDPRRFTVRLAADNGSISTVAGFQDYASKSLAEVAILDILSLAGVV